MRRLYKIFIDYNEIVTCYNLRNIRTNKCNYMRIVVIVFLLGAKVVKIYKFIIIIIYP